MTQPQVGMPQQYNSAPVSLPSRKPAITTLIIGLVVLFLVAPVTFFGLLFAKTGASFDDLVESDGATYRVENGDEITVGELGIAHLEVTPTTDRATCALVKDGESTGLIKDDLDEFDEGPATSTTFAALGVDPGVYKIDCQDLPDGAQLAVSDSAFTESIVEAGFIAFVWGSVAGIIGIVLTIAGTIWVVVVNRQRSRLYRYQGVRY
ncbi:MAG: hypothetical protein Q4D87_01150 [Actinomycetaceae bacterium]|nr:hypothetical protein [Actinomycetaceae bacterium]